MEVMRCKFQWNLATLNDLFYLCAKIWWNLIFNSFSNGPNLNNPDQVALENSVGGRENAGNQQCVYNSFVPPSPTVFSRDEKTAAV